MKDISNKLIRFLDEHISYKLTNLPLMHLTSDSNDMLSRLFEEMREAERQFKTATINEKWINFENVKIPKGVDYYYSPEMAKMEIEEACKFGCIFSFKIKGRIIQVSINFSETTENNSKICNDMIKRIFIWLYVSTQFASNKCSQKLNIYIYLTDLKKGLPTINSQIEQEHANSAFTTTCSTVSEIHIFREEEWFKVLIHETFHNMGLDFSGLDNKEINHCILSIFPIRTNQLRFFETYCEMWAEILNVMFISYFSTKTRSAIDIQIKKTLNMLKKEREFSLLQSAKVLNNLGLCYTDLYNNSSVAQHKRAHKYKESTPAFSYFILKSIMMFYLGDYLHWCAIHNGSSLQFNPNKLMEYCGFIREHYCRNDYLTSITIVENWLTSYSKSGHNKEIMKTLRMSLHEL